MSSRVSRSLISLGLLGAICGAAFAQEGSSDTSQTEILVTGQKEAKAVRDLAGSITRDPNVDKPVAQLRAPLCLKVVGLEDAYARLLQQRVEENALAVGGRVGKPGCDLNALVAFVDDAQAELARLRADEPWLFNELLSYQLAEIAAENNGAIGWHVQEMRDRAGRDIPTIIMKMPGPLGPQKYVEVRQLKDFGTTRLVPPIRMDLVGGVVLIERGAMGTRTLRQLADYASMRLLASTRDAGLDQPNPASILGLFAGGGDAPPALTAFDRAYLEALFDLPYNAGAGTLQNMTLRRFRGQIAREDASSAETEAGD